MSNVEFFTPFNFLLHFGLEGGGRGHKTKSEIGELLVNKFSREIHFSNKSFGNNHQEISRKVAGATNLYLKRNLKFSKIKKSLFHSHISKTLFNF